MQLIPEHLLRQMALTGSYTVARANAQHVIPQNNHRVNDVRTETVHLYSQCIVPLPLPRIAFL
jgi:hypothetical protein